MKVKRAHPATSSTTSRISGRPAGATLRAVASTPSVPAALKNAKPFPRVHPGRVERTAARAGERLDRALGRDPGEPATIDLDATQATVYGQRKQGAGRSRRGRLPYAPHVSFRAERGGRRPRSAGPTTSSSCCKRCAPRGSASPSRCHAAGRRARRSRRSPRAHGRRRSTCRAHRSPRRATRRRADRQSRCGWWCAASPSAPRGSRPAASAPAGPRRSTCPPRARGRALSVLGYRFVLTNIHDSPSSRRPPSTARSDAPLATRKPAR